MAFPKSTAEASLGNYRNAFVKRKYNHDYHNSMRIEPQFITSEYNCEPTGCMTERCSYICGFGPPIQWCEGTREKCGYYCCGFNANGYYECFEDNAVYRTECQ